MGAKATPCAGNQPPDLSSLGLASTEHAPLPMATVEGACHIVRYVNPAFCRLIDKNKDCPSCFSRLRRGELNTGTPEVSLP
jgi:hypothetical protein